MPKHPVLEPIKEPVKTKEDIEESRLVILRNEKNRLEKEIDILKIKYDNQQRLFQEQANGFKERFRVDLDKIEKGLKDNKEKETKLLKTQSEVNELKAKFEVDMQSQKDLLLRKEVELDEAKDEVKKTRAELLARLEKSKKEN